MAHSFLKKTIDGDTKRPHLLLFGYAAGAFLLLNSYAAQALGTPVQVKDSLAMLGAILLGAPLVYNGLRDLLTGNLEMNELAALSFTASFCTSQYQASAFIALFMIAAQVIEVRSQADARKNLEALMRLAPQKASIVTEAGYVEKNASDLAPGDLVQVLPGDRIPGDGIVSEGHSSVDESTLTGESVPVEKKAGSELFGGTINLTGRLLFRITRPATESTLAKIKEMIARAEQSRTASMRVVNAFATWYTPLILLLAGIVFFFTQDINRAVAMLIIACPCTVLLSGPTALVAALSAAARLGVIIRTVDVLETAAKIDTVVFDKTGTLTHGRFSVIAVNSLNGFAPDDLLQLAGSIGRFSHHPVSGAVAAECTARGLEFIAVEQFVEHAGSGIRGCAGGRNVSIGRRDWIESQCGKTYVSPVEQSPATQVNVSVDTHHAGTVELADLLKPDAAEVISQLREDRIKNVIMLTGDRHSVASKIAGQLGCDFEAEVLPERKMRRVEEVKLQGRTVAVVGDGVNDAPALAAGDVGIAMGIRGSDVTVHSASIVLMNDKLNRIPFVFRLARNVSSVIRWNLAFSSLFIVVSLVLSAGGAIPPVLAAVLHTLSTGVVMFNSARLLRVGENIE